MNIFELKEIINQYKDKILKFSIFKHPYRKKECKILFKEITLKYFNIFKSFNELMFLSKNYDNLENIHIFCKCGKKNKFHNCNIGYSKYCSNKCQMNDPKIKQYRKSIQDKMNIKMIQTAKNNIDKNGLNSYQRSIIKQKYTKKERYGDENYNNSIKRETTCLKKYKSKNVMQNKIIINQMVNTKKNNIDENGLNSFQRNNAWKQIKVKEHCKRIKKERYGNENYNNINKAKQTCLNKYGVDSYTKSQQFKNLFKDKNWLNNVKQKEYYTKKKNNSFTKSQTEDECYKLLCNKFDKVERQYKSSVYPFRCDLYIPQKDLYIECHFTFTHNHKPFKNSIEDLIELEKLKEKANEINFKGKKKDYYKTVIDVWTKRDPLKLSYFKKNKLNYKIFYNINQFLNWYNKEIIC